MSESVDRRIRLNSALYVHSIEDVIAYLFEDYEKLCSDWKNSDVDNVKHLCYCVADLVTCRGDHGITPEEGAKVISAVAGLPDEVVITVENKKRPFDFFGCDWGSTNYKEVTVTVPMCNIMKRTHTQIEAGIELSKDLLFIFEF